MKSNICGGVSFSIWPFKIGRIGRIVKCYHCLLENIFFSMGRRNNSSGTNKVKENTSFLAFVLRRILLSQGVFCSQYFSPVYAL